MLLDKDLFVIENNTTMSNYLIKPSHTNMTLKIFQDHITCQDYEDLKINAAGAMRKEIKVIVRYEVKEKIPQSGTTFCQSCVLLNPNDRPEAEMSLYINTGCKNDTCITDLKVVSATYGGNETMKENAPMALGTFTNFTIQYNVSSLAEPSFGTNLKITIPPRVKFSKTLESCNVLERNTMNCRIKPGGSLKQNDKTESIKISFDISEFRGDLLEIIAEVSSKGNETNPEDNIVKNSFNLFENSTVTIKGY